MSKLSLPEIKKQLKTYEADELLSIIMDCYKSSAEVKKYIHMLLDPEFTEKQLFDEAKKKIKQQFYPERGNPKLKFAEARKAISDYTKLSGNQAKTIELMVYYVELGVQLANDYGDMYEAFYNSMLSMYESALNKINKDQLVLFPVYRDRLRAILYNTNDMGWGFHDYLCDVYYNYFSDYEEDSEEV